MTQTEAESRWGSELEEVVRWRFEELRRAGYGSEAAFVIAMDTEIDLHLATELLGKGCPAETALRILF